MEQENKKLLLLDLCARLPYGVKIKTSYDKISKPVELRSVNFINGTFAIGNNHVLISGLNFDTHECKPYLFPLSSMTIEQKEEERSIKEEFYYSFDANENIYTLQDFYNKNHIDYRGLIPMGLAIDCTNLNIY